MSTSSWTTTGPTSAEGQAAVCTPPALPPAFHSDQCELAQSSRTLLREDYDTTQSARDLRERGRVGNGHHDISDASQPTLQTVCLNGDRRRHPRQGQTIANELRRQHTNLGGLVRSSGGRFTSTNTAYGLSVFFFAAFEIKRRGRDRATREGDSAEARPTRRSLPLCSVNRHRDVRPPQEQAAPGAHAAGDRPTRRHAREIRRRCILAFAERVLPRASDLVGPSVRSISASVFSGCFP